VSTPNTEKTEDQKAKVEKLKQEWKLMWSDRYDDKIKAEGVSVENYTLIKVDRGTIIHATRDYKAMDFREILEQNSITNTDRFIQPHKEEGGWAKFAKKEIIPNSPKNQRLAIKHEMEAEAKKNTKQQPKKGGRGWLHTT